MFETLERTIELVNTVSPVVKAIGRKSAPLADQLRRAVESVALNTGEARWRTGKDRTLRYRYAAGSAQEAHTALKVAVAWGYVSEAEVAAALVLLDRVMAMMWRLLHPRR